MVIYIYRQRQQFIVFNNAKKMLHISLYMTILKHKYVYMI